MMSISRIEAKSPRSGVEVYSTFLDFGGFEGREEEHFPISRTSWE